MWQISRVIYFSVLKCSLEISGALSFLIARRSYNRNIYYLGKVVGVHGMYK